MNLEEFKIVYMPLQHTLFKVAYYILESENDAQDAVQELYLKLWSKRKNLVDVANPKAYAITLLKNICLDRIKSASNRKKDNIEKVEIESQRKIEDDIDAKIKLDLIQKIMLTLPKREALILKMKYFDGLEYEEISRITGINYLSQRVLLSKARKKIRKYFKLHSE